MNARIAAPDEQIAEQLSEMIHTRAWFWANRKQPLTSPSKYAETVVARISEALVSES